MVDRLVLAPGLEQRLAESIETALARSDGLLIVEDADTGEQTLLSAKFACPVSGFTIEEIEPRLFSFNSPHGACPACDGLGRRLYMDPALVVPDPEKSLYDGAIEPWSSSSSTYYLQTLDGIAKHFGASLHTPWEELPEAMQDLILNGSGEEAVELSYDDGLRRYGTKRPFEGVLPNLQRRWRETDSAWLKEELGRYLSSAPCEACAGHRLKPEALAVKVGGRHVGEVTELAIEDAAAWFRALPEQLTAKHNEIASRILKEINERLGFLRNVGLGYLTLARDAGSLSGGESQRIRLASQIGSGLTGVLYVLDEPSIGLHQRDNHRLLETLKNLRDLGNTVIVVEHDEDAIREADHVVDMGPGAGAHGGLVVAEGTPAAILAAPESLTGQYLVGRRQIPLPLVRRQAKRGHWLTLVGAAENNLKERRRGDPARHLHLRHRGLGQRQVDARARHALPGARQAPAQGAARCRARTSASRAWSSSTRWSTSTSRRSAARRAPTPRPTPAASPRSATGSRACPRRRRAATGPGASRSTSRAGAARPARATA